MYISQRAYLFTVLKGLYIYIPQYMIKYKHTVIYIQNDRNRMGIMKMRFKISINIYTQVYTTYQYLSDHTTEIAGTLDYFVRESPQGVCNFDRKS